MKNLKQYIDERLNESNEESKDFIFNFTDIENGEETVKSLSELNNENIKVEDKKVTVTIKKDIDIETAQDILQQAIQSARSSKKSNNYEDYAQKTAKLERTLGEMNEFIDKVNNPEETETEKEDDKKEDE